MATNSTIFEMTNFQYCPSVGLPLAEVLSSWLPTWHWAFGLWFPLPKWPFGRCGDLAPCLLPACDLCGIITILLWRHIQWHEFCRCRCPCSISHPLAPCTVPCSTFTPSPLSPSSNLIAVCNHLKTSSIAELICLTHQDALVVVLTAVGRQGRLQKKKEKLSQFSFELILKMFSLDTN